MTALALGHAVFVVALATLATQAIASVERDLAEWDHLKPWGP